MVIEVNERTLLDGGTWDWEEIRYRLRSRYGWKMWNERTLLPVNWLMDCSVDGLIDWPDLWMLDGSRFGCNGLHERRTWATRRSQTPGTDTDIFTWKHTRHKHEYWKRLRRSCCYMYTVMNMVVILWRTDREKWSFNVKRSCRLCNYWWVVDNDEQTKSQRTQQRLMAIKREAIGEGQVLVRQA